MAFSRLFGKSKREVPSPTENLETTEKDDTVIVSNSLYPAVNQQAVEALPYQLPSRTAPAAPAVASEQFQNMSIRQDSTGHWTPLQGIKFTLNSR